jgi:hypothetical protein
MIIFSWKSLQLCLFPFEVSPGYELNLNFLSHYSDVRYVFGQTDGVAWRLDVTFINGTLDYPLVFENLNGNNFPIFNFLLDNGYYMNLND